MKNLTTTLCLTISVLLGSAGVSWSDDFEKGHAAFKIKDYKTAARLWTPLAEQGDARARERLGILYSWGWGVPQDNSLSLKWTKLSAEQGNRDAQYNLGALYMDGRIVLQNDKIALEWIRLAAEQKHPEGLRILGVYYQQGKVVTKDIRTAFKYYKLAAAEGHVFAKYILKTDPEFRKLRAEEVSLQKNKEKQRIEIEKFRETCSNFGFKEGSKEMSNCMFELYKIDRSKSQSQNVGQNAPSTTSGTAPEVRALIEEQRRAAEAQRKAIEAQQGIEIMRQGLEMMKPNQQNNSNGFRIGPNGNIWNCRNGICTK